MPAFDLLTVVFVFAAIGVLWMMADGRRNEGGKPWQEASR